MPSADFSHAVRAGCPALSQNSVARDFSKGTWEISRGKHVSFGTWMPSIRALPEMDRGFCLVLQAHPTMHACRRSRLRGLGFYSSPHTFAAPCLDRAASFRSTVAGTPLLAATPFASIGLGLRLVRIIKYMINLTHF